MAQSVNSVVLQLEAKLADYNRQVDGAASTTERAMQRVNVASTETERQLGRSRIGFQQLSMQIGDMSTMFALGARPMQIFASQSAQVIQAVQLMAGGTSRFAAFLGGPWGIAISTALIALTPLVAKMFEGEQAADALRDAEGRLSSSMVNLIESRVELDRALGRNIDYYREVQRIAVETAMKEVEAARSTVQTRLALLREEQRSDRYLGGMRASGDETAAANASILRFFGLGDTRDEVVSLMEGTAELNDAMASLNNTQARLARMLREGEGGAPPRSASSTPRPAGGGAAPAQRGETEEDRRRAQHDAMLAAQAQDEFEANKAQEAKQAEQDAAQRLQNKIKAEADLRARAEEELQAAARRREEENLRDVADLYQALFTEGVDGVWGAFKRQGLAAIAQMAAAWTLAMINGQKVSFGSILQSGSGGGGFLGSLLASIGPALAGAKANGGPVSGGRPYLVGERGPEIFMPQGNGVIIPNQRLASAAPAGPSGVVRIRIEEAPGFAATVQAEAVGAAVEVYRVNQPGTVERAVQEVARRGGRPRL